VPRLAGATPEDLASRYVGRTASPEVIHQIAQKLGFTDPIWVQYGRFVKGLVLGADYSTGPTTVHCPAPCFGYSFLTQNPVLPDLLDRLPVTMSLAAGGALIWLVAGVSTGVVSALRRGSVFDRAAMGVALAGVSLPIFARWQSRAAVELTASIAPSPAFIAPRSSGRSPPLNDRTALMPMLAPTPKPRTSRMVSIECPILST